MENRSGNKKRGNDSGNHDRDEDRNRNRGGRGRGYRKREKTDKKMPIIGKSRNILLIYSL